MSNSSWIRGRNLGRGSTATVSLATDTRSGELFAVKSAELSRSSLLQREQRILSSLHSPHIVSYLGFDVTAENGRILYNLLLEYASGGTLSDEIKRQGGCLDELSIRSRTCAIVMGLSYLHSEGLAHCDVKGNNVLIGPDGCAKLADFGCAKWVDGAGEGAGSAGGVIGGTPVYMAPEVARGEEQGMPADVWALGCTVIEMATGRSPWPDVSDPVSAIHRIAFSADVPEFPTSVSGDGKDFLSKCLRRNPKERWTVNELLQHPFLSSNLQWSSPKSILDQGFWNSLEEDEREEIDEQLDENLISVEGESSNPSPAERIGQLSSASATSPMDNWTWDENWLTIRGNRTAITAAAECSYSSEGQNENQIMIGDNLAANGSQLVEIGSCGELMGFTNYITNCDCSFHHLRNNVNGDSCNDTVVAEFVGVDDRDGDRSQGFTMRVKMLILILLVIKGGDCHRWLFSSIILPLHLIFSSSPLSLYINDIICTVNFN